MITRVTQRMLTDRSLSSVENGLTRMSKAQEQMTTGRRLNRPSDSPTDTTVALRARAGVAQQTQFQRNAQDGISWLSTIDSTIQGTTDQVRRAYTLAVQGANTASNGASASSALADEVDQIKKSLVDFSNTQYLGRPIFGGTTTSGAAFTMDGAGVVTYTGNGNTAAGQVNRRVGVDSVVRVDSDGTKVFGADGDNVFDHLTALSTALRTVPADSAGIEQGIAALQADMDRLSSAAADEGARMNQINQASTVASATQLALQKTQSDVEDVDVAQATIELQTQTNAYQAALMAVSKTSQRSLLDFLS
jgi:flagellar hook-associated protein 3 FlgL